MGEEQGNHSPPVVSHTGQGAGEVEAIGTVVCGALRGKCVLLVGTVGAGIRSPVVAVVVFGRMRHCKPRFLMVL